MKKFEISAYGVEEMKCQELVNTDAGTELGYAIGYYGGRAGRWLKRALSAAADAIGSYGNFDMPLR